MIVFCLLVLFHTSSFGGTIWSRGCCANSAELAWCARGFGNSCTCEMIALHVVYNSFTFRSPSAGWILERTQTLASILAGSWLVQRDYTGGRGGGASKLGCSGLWSSFLHNDESRMVLNKIESLFGALFGSRWNCNFMQILIGVSD